MSSELAQRAVKKCRCGQKMFVLDSRQGLGYIRRRYHCKKCGERRSSKEFFHDPEAPRLTDKQVIYELASRLGVRL